MARRPPSAGQEEGWRQKPNSLAFWPNLQNYEKINVCCVSQAACDILSWPPELTKAAPKTSSTELGLCTNVVQNRVMGEEAPASRSSSMAASSPDEDRQQKMLKRPWALWCKSVDAGTAEARRRMKPHEVGRVEPPMMGTPWQAGLTTANQPRCSGESPFPPWFQLLTFWLRQQVFDCFSIWFSRFAP